MVGETVDFSFFDGKRFTLTAVDTSQTFGRYNEYADDDSCGIAFTLDGITYAAVEDPCDDYRSCLGKIVVMAADTAMSTPIPPHKVFGRHVTKREGAYYECDVIELVDLQTGKPVVIFGTDNSDDYYPSFIDDYEPKNLAANSETQA